MKKIEKYVLAIFLLLLIACATVVAPSGGPEDKLPPRVAAVYPAPNATGISPELFVRLEFDEWINPSLSRNAVMISPPLEKKLKLEVSGDVLEITSKAVLDSNTTYTLILGNSLKDLRGNPISPPFQMSFSTGNSIDSLVLVGKVMLTEEMIKGKQWPSIGLYPLGKDRERRNYLKKYRDSSLVDFDSLPALTREVPLFFTQADSNGNFKAVGLSKGKYRLMAFVDDNGNRRLEPSSEAGGIYGDIELDSLFKDTLYLPLGNLDTSYVVLDSVRQLNASVIQPIFSRKVNPDSFLGCHLYGASETLLDSLEKIIAYNEMPAFLLNESLQPDSSYTFRCAFARDSLGIGLDSVRNEFDFIYKEFKADTLPSKITSVLPSSGTKFIFPKDPIVLTFDKKVFGDSLDKELFIMVRKDTLPVKVSRLDAVRFEVYPESEIPFDAKVSLQQRYLDSTLSLPDSTGKRDTLVEVKFKVLTSFETVPKLRLASLNGKIPCQGKNLKVRLRSVETGIIRDTLCHSEGNFIFSNLLDGKYILDYFYTTENNQLDVGRLQPIEFAKPWRISPDTLVLKPGENKLEHLVTLPSMP